MRNCYRRLFCNALFCCDCWTSVQNSFKAALKMNLWIGIGWQPKPDTYYYILGSWTFFSAITPVYLQCKYLSGHLWGDDEHFKQCSGPELQGTSSVAVILTMPVSYFGFLLETLASVDQRYKEGIATDTDTAVTNSAKTIPLIQRQCKCRSDRKGKLRTERSILWHVGEME